MQIKELLKNIQIARLDNRLLISSVTGFNATQIITNDDYCLNDTQLIEYNQLLKRALDGEPLAYITGSKEFYSREFIVTSDTLIPRPETELIIDLVKTLAKPNYSILDLGTGTGCIAINCKLECSSCRVTAVDYYDKTLAIAKLNGQRLNANVNFIQSDWFSNIKEKFDIIVSNPPYIESNDEHLTSLKYEPIHALTDFNDGLSAIKTIIENSATYLNDNGYLIFEHGYNQAEKVQQMLYNCGFTEIETIKDYAGLDRITYGILSQTEQ